MRYCLLILTFMLLACQPQERKGVTNVEVPLQKSSPEKPVLNEKELALRAMLNGAQLTGSFSMKGKHALDGVAKDTYVISSIDKAEGDLWQFMVRITYLNTDINVPLFLPVKWAEDTAIVYVDKVFVPGAGTYSARVLFYKDQYAGVWEGDGYGGQLMGTITPLPDK